jgi:gluconolactonase
MIAMKPDLGRRRLLSGVAGLGALTVLQQRGLAIADGGRPSASTQFRIVATGLAAPEGPVVMADGSVLVCEMLEGRLSRVLPNGEVAVVAQTAGAPNGAAIGPDGACYITNNGGMNSERVDGKLVMRPGLPPGYKSGSIQRIDLKSGQVETLYTQAGPAILRGPNDLVFDESGGFYFTDLGKVLTGDHIDSGAVYWARPDGSDIRQVVPNLVTPNGIALSPDGRTLYVALTQKRQILGFNVVGPGQLETQNGQVRERVVASLDGKLSFDSMKVEQGGNLVVGTLQVGCLTVFSPTGMVVDQVYLPDMNVTNLAFGGPRMRTAFVTLTITGRLAAVAWPRAGLKLQYQGG